jgi:hypothetical protein
MEFSDLVTITQGSLPIMNPVSPEKIIAIGKAAGLSSGDSVIECGCGNGTLLSLWGEEFGISGTGIEIRSEACEQAGKIIKDRGLLDRIAVRCGDAATFVPESAADCAVSLGASFIWGGFAEALEALRGMVHEKSAPSTNISGMPGKPGSIARISSGHRRTTGTATKQGSGRHASNGLKVIPGIPTGKRCSHTSAISRTSTRDTGVNISDGYSTS